VAGVSADDADEAGVSLNAVEQASNATILRLKSIYASLPDRTLLLVYPGPRDMKEVGRLQEMQKQFKKEFKVKKWDELSVQWTDNEAQALRKAFQEARQGWALVGLK
jgi:RNA exonuclease 1